MPKEVYGHGKGRVKSIPKAYWGIGKRVPQIVRKTSGKFIFNFNLVLMSEHFVGFPPSDGTRN